MVGHNVGSVGYGGDGQEQDPVEVKGQRAAFFSLTFVPIIDGV